MRAAARAAKDAHSRVVYVHVVFLWHAYADGETTAANSSVSTLSGARACGVKEMSKHCAQHFLDGVSPKQFPVRGS